MLHSLFSLTALLLFEALPIRACGTPIARRLITAATPFPVGSEYSFCIDTDGSECTMFQFTVAERDISGLCNWAGVTDKCCEDAKNNLNLHPELDEVFDDAIAKLGEAEKQCHPVWGVWKDVNRNMATATLGQSDRYDIKKELRKAIVHIGEDPPCIADALDSMNRALQNYQWDVARYAAMAYKLDFAHHGADSLLWHKYLPIEHPLIGLKPVMDKWGDDHSLWDWSGTAHDTDGPGGHPKSGLGYFWWVINSFFCPPHFENCAEAMNNGELAKRNKVYHAQDRY